ncbi:hypothetical protein BS47DRAFT_480163 [Hydnum rufescens UP504]|uniref:Acireductone dioxygenase n=1 Tax=Hydnum rufescens UP504 TaxID=1448309 RepID=A0A9P6DPU6_9AGAM|nr:hypothetical protein BS47DRAFT_480163 [Hydnum rufescens UP504]
MGLETSASYEFVRSQSEVSACHPYVRPLIMKAYRFNDASYVKNPDQRLAHTYEPEQLVSVEALDRLGVKYWSIPIQGWEPKIDAIAAERAYKNRDLINVTKEGLGELYESKIKSFFEEHLHEDEEIRYILDGSGYFDVRDFQTDSWIRIGVVPGDLLVLPAGIYHRFTLDHTNAIKALRLFQDEPKWIPYNRSPETDRNPFRQEYAKSVSIAV